ncbi:AI-2E family transporter [Acidobacteria bacterium AB60]|nr:AI-2E family transporter [Acidobacteria bacterium AB60]
MGATPKENESRRTARSYIVFAFVVAFACYLAWLLRHELLLVYVSALFAVVLQPALNGIAGIRIGRFQPFRRTAILVLLLCVAGGAALFGFLAVPPIVRDLQEFSKELPQRLPQLVEKLRRVPFADRIDPGDLVERVETTAANSAAYVLLSLKNWASALFTIGMGLILTVYFELEGDVAYRWVLSFFRRRTRERLDGTLTRAKGRMGRWLIGQGSLMLILGVAATGTYAALHVRYAYALGVLTGLLNIIPVVGAAVCICLALVVASFDSWGRVLGVAIFYFVWINLENSFLVPRIMKSSVDLPGLAVIVALLIGSALAGVVGAAVAVPTAVLVAVLAEEYLVQRD